MEVNYEGVEGIAVHLGGYMWSIVFDMLKILLSLLGFLAIIGGLLISPIVFMIAVNYFKGILSGRKVAQLPKHLRYKKKGFLRRLVIDFPKQYVEDLFNRDPFDFDEHGLHMFCGRQGAGKTIAMTDLIMRWQKRYPLLQVFTNMGFKHEQGVIEHWKHVVGFNNGTRGAVMTIDEIQTWFSSNQSKNFPPEMITEISQQRKQRKCILGSAQVFSRIAKPIREQTTYVYMPQTYFGCLTIVRVTRPEFWDDEKQEFKKYLKTYFFVHDDALRDAYDTYHKIEKYKEDGFQEFSPLRMAE